MARAEGILGNALEARVILEADRPTLEELRLDPVFLQDLFIVSQVTLVPAPAGAAGRQVPFEVRVERAAGEKCERCWHVTNDVGSDAELRTLCARCVGAVRSILAARGAGA